MTDRRPDPETVLQKVTQQERRRQRGRLKVFFGAAPGVGKTYAMLAAGQERRSDGLDVVIGVVETHGRADTEALLGGLERLPYREIAYRGTTLHEFDLDAALARRPALILIDELAHTNAPQSRHAKRWQDIEELLTSGIDVFSTLNVQHLESLNDVVGQVTGIRVWETVPDRVLDDAEEIALVDITPDELLQRLREGKIYLAQQAARAVDNFFRKGNLIALRELALRRTAERVDAQMRAYRDEQSIRQVWQGAERVIVAIGPDGQGETLVRAARRLTSSLRAEWTAVYVETPATQRLPAAKRERVLSALRLAEQLGARTASLSGQDLVATLVDYVRSQNATKLILAKSASRRLRPVFGRSLVAALAVQAPDVDFYLVGNADRHAPERPAGKTPGPSEGVWLANYGWSLVGIAAVTLLCLPLAPHVSLVNIIMLYLLAVVGLAARLGRGAGIASSIAGVLAFDYFFVPPRLSFAVSDTQYLLTFSVMLVVALLVSGLTASLARQAQVLTHRERRAHELYDLATQLSGALVVEQIVAITLERLRGLFGADAAVLLPDGSGTITVAPGQEAPLPGADLGIAQWVYENEQAAGYGTDTIAAANALYLPLKAPMRTRGVLALRLPNPRQIAVPEQRRLLEALAAQIALALERVHFVEVAQETQVRIASEQLRNSLLSAVSHDLRTPLTAIVGLAHSLAQRQLSAVDRVEAEEALYDEAMRLNNLVRNLLDMAQLRSGSIALNRQWQPVEEVVGSAVTAMRRHLGAHELSTAVPANAPWVWIDSVLIERVLVNLIENAVKYTPAGTRIVISGIAQRRELEIRVCDNGPGIAADARAQLFEHFVRGPEATETPGTGLGLAIARAIVEAHQGRIWTTEVPEGGICFAFALPLAGPTLPEMDSVPAGEGG